MSAVAQSDSTRDRWCWPRSESDGPATDILSIEVPPRGHVGSESPLMLTSVYSYSPTSSISERACRICLESDDLTVESACACTGTQRFVHPDCQLRWRLSGPEERRNVCEICHARYRNTVSTDDEQMRLHHFRRHQRDASMSLNLMWILATGLMVLDIINIVFQLHDDAGEGTTSGNVSNPWVSHSMLASSASKVALFVYIVWIEKSFRATMTCLMFVYGFALTYEYNTFMHLVLNFSFNTIAIGIMSNVESSHRSLE